MEDNLDLHQGAADLSAAAMLGGRTELPAAPALHAAAPEPDIEITGMHNVTYFPDEHDPSVTICHGVRFRANVPTLVSNEVLLKLLVKNPWFQVEGYERARRGAPKGTPKTPEDYCAYAIKWFLRAKEGKNANEFKLRWQSEQALRDACGVGEDDLERLSTIGDPILAELEKRGETEDQDAA